MTSRKNLEIILSQSILGFTDPKIKFEQYQTPSRVASNLVFYANMLNEIHSKTVVDICAGTGILGIAASILGGIVSMVEIDADVIEIQRKNIDNLNLTIDSIHNDVLAWFPDEKFDTALLNPPFGIQQKKYTDIKILKKATKIANICYSIHDGSPTNIERLPKLLMKEDIEILGSYTDEFNLPVTYSWHSNLKKINKVLVLRTKAV
ncbi:MAG: methyltransferase [Candidatus Heimdallarchaeota archaeon]|nr:methyltransferase [Candidatus Heimdallarchaeota archaeon]MDH5646971.1 methyltransferase [Candidatus Heimdallarchaeota archaeon]